jgi:hypothetical protein
MQQGMIDSGTLVSAEVSVSTAGTAVQIAATGKTLKWGVLFKALAGNSGMIYVGNVSNDVASTNGIELDAGEQIFIPAMDLSDIWIDASVNGEDVRVLYG